MLLDGFGPTAVADFIQKEKKEYTDISRGTLVGTLRKYRASVPKADLIRPKLPDYVEKADAVLRKSINELDELQDLYLLQRNRIEIDHKLEREVRKLIPTTNQEVRLASEILRTSAQLKVDLGMTADIMGGASAGESLTAKLANKVTNAAVAKVLEDPQSRLRLTALATKLMGLAVDQRVEKVLQGDFSAVIPALAAPEPQIQDAIIEQGPPSPPTDIPTGEAIEPVVEPVLPAMLSGDSLEDPDSEPEPDR